MIIVCANFHSQKLSYYLTNDYDLLFRISKGHFDPEKSGTNSEQSVFQLD